MDANAKEKAATIVCLLVSIIIALTYGFTFYESNQNTYLLGSLSALGLEPLENDWLVSSSKIYHTSFAYVIQIFSSTGLDVAVLSMIFDFILRVVAYFFFIKTFSPKQEKMTFLLLVGILLVFDGAISVGGSYLFSIILQPSSLGATFTVLAISAYVTNKNLAASVLIVAAGVFHANFLILMVPLLSFAFLLDFFYRTRSMKDVAFLLLPMWTFLLLKLPSFLGYVGVDEGIDPDYLFQFIRSPHHYNTNSFLQSFIEILGWAILGGLSLVGVGCSDERLIRARFLYVSLALALVFAFVFTSIFYVSFVSKVFIWRVAPIFELMSYVLISYYIIFRSLRLGKIELLFFGFGLILVILGKVEEWDSLRKYIVVAIFISFIFLYYLISSKFPKLIRSCALPVTSIFFTLYGFYSVYSVNENSKYGVRTVPDSRVDIYEWIQENTDVKSVFQTPLYFEDFRLKAQRAMVVDWKSTPVDPEGLSEWYRRILAVSCIEFEYYMVNELHSCYNQASLEKIESVSDLYGVDYYIFINSTEIDFLDPKYIGSEYTIYTVEGD